ncbi:MAG: hypothetical protein QME51_06605, partial [Planctomycetota bacterium]|nr:hypothetical protein [Planctomycetota bacterium]
VKKVEQTVNTVSKIAENVESITQKIDKGEGTLSKLINEPGLYDSAKQAVDSTHSLGRSFDEVEALVKEAREAVENISKITESLESITAKIDRGEGSLGRILNDPGLYDSAKEAVDSTRTIVESIKSTKIFVGAEGNFYDDASIMNFHIRVVPRESRYFLLGGAIINPSDDTSISATVTGTAAEQKFATEFIVAQKLFDCRLTLRAGLLEGKIGGGVDYAPFPAAKDTVLFTVEGRNTYIDSDFNERMEMKKKTLVRVKATLKFLKYFHIAIGSNDIRNKNPDFFVGIGFEYLDEDISKIIGLVGAGK